MRKAFNFYRSYYDVLEKIPTDKDKLEYLLAICNRQFKGIEPSLEGFADFAYTSQKHSIDKSVEGWESKTKTKLTPSQGPTEGPTQGSSLPPSLQEQEKEQEEVEEEVKEEVKVQIHTIENFFSEPEVKSIPYRELPWEGLGKNEKEIAESYLDNLLSKKI